MRKGQAETKKKEKKTKINEVEKTDKKTSRKDKKVLKFKQSKSKVLNKKTVIFFLVVVIFIGAIGIYNNYTSLGIVLRPKITSKDAKVVKLESSNNKIIAYNSSILVYGNGKIICVDKFGNVSWQVDVKDTINTEIMTAGKYIQILDKDTKMVYVYKNKYEVARIKFKESIMSANINEEGYSTVEYISSGSKKAIAVFDKNGNQKYDVKLNTEMLGIYNLSSNLKYLVYTELDTSGISAVTKVNLVNLNSKNTSGKNIEIYTDESSLVYDVYFAKNKVIMRTNGDFVIYDLDSKKIDKRTISSSSYENIGVYGLNYAYTKINDDARYILKVASILKSNEKEAEIEEPPRYFVYKNGLSFVCFAKKIEIFNEFGKMIKEFESDYVITKPVVFNNGKSVALLLSNKLMMFTI